MNIFSIYYRNIKYIMRKYYDMGELASIQKRGALK